MSGTSSGGKPSPRQAILKHQNQDITEKPKHETYQKYMKTEINIKGRVG